MSSDNIIPPIPVAWLRPFPSDYKIPLWRWIILPAGAFMLNRNKGVWVSGSLELTASDLRFSQTKSVLPSRNKPLAWSIPLADISAAPVTKAIASDTLKVRYTGGTVKFMTVRAHDFIARLQAAIAR